MNINILYKITGYYKNKYHLYTLIDIVKDYAFTSFKPNIDAICLSLEYINKRYKEKAFINRFKNKNITKLYIFCLLHELYHAIDFYNNKDLFCQQNLIDQNLDHNRRPQEIEADNFAKKEIKKWT